MTGEKKRVLFVCIGNSCRSQMAEALAHHFASDVIDPSSAGLSPLGSIAMMTRKVLLERGIDLSRQYSKGVEQVDVAAADLIVNMTGMPGKAIFPAAQVVDWDIEDPFGEDLSVHRRICDEIEERVKELAASLRGEAPQPKTT